MMDLTVIFHFGLFFALKISKNGKIGYQKLLLHDAWFLRYIYMVYDRRMGRQKK